MRYENMTKDQLLDELLDRGIACFSEVDSNKTLIEALYQDDRYLDDHPDVYVKPTKESFD